MKIRPVKHEGAFPKNRYCGPAALSIISGISTGEAAKLLRVITGARAIRGTYTSSMRWALEDLGYAFASFTEYRVRKARPTLARWLREHKAIRTSGRVYLIAAGNHWQVVSGRRYCCGLTGAIVSVRDEQVRRRARVSEVYEIVPEKPTHSDSNNWNAIKRGYA